MVEVTRGDFGGLPLPPPPQESFTTDELRLLQGIMMTDRKTLDFIEGVVGGTDLTERRAAAALVTMKIRRMLDWALSTELQARQELAQQAMLTKDRAAKEHAEEAERRRREAEEPPAAPAPDVIPPVLEG